MEDQSVDQFLVVSVLLIDGHLNGWLKVREHCSIGGWASDEMIVALLQKVDLSMNIDQWVGGQWPVIVFWSVAGGLLH